MSNSRDPGLGSQYTKPISRFVNANGDYNIIHKGAIGNFRDVYKSLIEVSRTHFFLLSFGTYFILNFIFAGIYMFIGMEELTGTENHTSDLLNAFLFSVQTFTTVGYGFISPVGVWAGLVSTVEAFIGLGYFALITGLIYGRFSRPSSKIVFSKNAILTPFEDGNAIMFKMVNRRKSILMKARAECTLSIDKGLGNKAFNKEYHKVKLQMNSIQFFALTWTIVHKIDDTSPFAGMSVEDLKKRNAELIVLVEAFDETFNQNIVERSSYAGDQWLGNVKFDRNFKMNPKGHLELYINEIDQLIPLD